MYSAKYIVFGVNIKTILKRVIANRAIIVNNNL